MKNKLSLKELHFRREQIKIAIALFKTYAQENEQLFFISDSGNQAFISSALTALNEHKKRIEDKITFTHED